MRQVLIWSGVTLAILLAACADAARAPAPEATLEPAATATPAEPEVRHTGIADLDTIIDAVGAGDEEALRELIRFESIPCVGPTPGNVGGPPLCSDDETPGETVTILRGIGCHGDYGREAVILRAIANLPYAVYAVVRESEGYHIVYSLPPSQSGEDSVGRGLRVQDGRIITFTNRCAQPAEDFVEGVAPEGFVLPPLEPDARRTGIAELDTVPDVLFAGDADAVRDLVSFTAAACEAEPIGLGAPPMCRPDEPDGTAVDVYPHSYCEGVYIRPEDMEGKYSSLASASGRLYAVYRAPDTYSPPTEYVVIYTDASTRTGADNALAVWIADGRIIGSYSGCAGTPEEFIDSYRLKDLVLPPLP